LKNIFEKFVPVMLPGLIAVKPLPAPPIGAADDKPLTNIDISGEGRKTPLKSPVELEFSLPK